MGRKVIAKKKKKAPRSTRRGKASTPSNAREPSVEEATMTAVEAVTDNADEFGAPSSPMTSIALSDAGTNSGLMKLPLEIRQKIFGFAVAESEPITPIQVKPRSNRFFWTKSQFHSNRNNEELGGKIVQGKVFGIPQLTVVQLAKVCRQFYMEAIHTHLFYKVNEFKFLTVVDMATYLVGITPARMAAIRSIEAPISSGGSIYVQPNGDVGIASSVYTILANCKGLRSLELRIDSLVYHTDYSLNKFFPPPGFKELKVAVRGLRSLSVVINQQPIPADIYHLSPDEGALQKFRHDLDLGLQAEVVHKRNFSYSEEVLNNARSIAVLDIEGAGRINNDIRPGVVAYRTRQQILHLDNIDSDGTIPKAGTPKYNLDGTLAWYVSSVSASRESDEGVEFLVKARPRRDFYTPNINSSWGNIDNYNDSLPTQESWEDASVLPHCYYVVDFFENNPTAYGKKIVLEMWKVPNRKNTGDEEILLKRTMNSATIWLNRLVKKDIRLQKKAEKAQAIAEARTEAKAAKAKAKAAKAKAKAAGKATTAKGGGKSSGGTKGKGRVIKVTKGKRVST